MSLEGIKVKTACHNQVPLWKHSKLSEQCMNTFVSFLRITNLNYKHIHIYSDTDNIHKIKRGKLMSEWKDCRNLPQTPVDVWHHRNHVTQIICSDTRAHARVLLWHACALEVCYRKAGKARWSPKPAALHRHTHTLLHTDIRDRAAHKLLLVK